jgi:transposase
VEAVLRIARTGCPWRDLPGEFGKGNTVFKRFRRWVKADAFHRMFRALSEGADFEYAMIDVSRPAPLMEWMAPASGIAMCHIGCSEHSQQREPSMVNVTTIGVDLAKSVFQLHGVDAEGSAVLRRQLKRSQMLEFFQRQPTCLIGMEACAGAHYWARELVKLGHDVRLMQPSYVKGHVKRGKADKADAEAICEAVSRPSMRFVPVKSEETQGLLLTHKAREFLVRQQTQIVNAMRAHLGEFGIVVPKGIHNVERLIAACDRADLPAPARKALNLLADQLADTQKKIDALTADIRADAKANEAAQRLQTIPGIGPITASALVSALPDIAGFKSGRDLSAWLGVRSVSRTDRVPAPHRRDLIPLLAARNAWVASPKWATGICAACSVPVRSRRSAPGAVASPAKIGCARSSSARNRNRQRSPWLTAWRAPPMR